MATRRQRQMAELLHQEISLLLQREARDPRLGFVTVTGVDVTADLKTAYVYVTVLGDDTDTQSTLEGLKSATKYLRHRLGQDLKLRHVPELIFKNDTSLAYGMHIDNLLDTIKETYDDPEPDNTEDAD